MKLLYVTSSSFSGSTLLAFLLNTHPDIFTVSEMEGWNYGEDEEFYCSCGNPLERCPFFNEVAHAFQRDGLPFAWRDFGTAYRLAKNERLNRYLTESLPWISNSPLERLRDGFIAHTPGFAARLRRHDQANKAFVRTALAYSKASVFVDGSKNPFRLRLLQRVRDFDLRVLYLIRDFRGVALSNMKTRGCNPRRATEIWLHDQSNILRVLAEFPGALHVYYEDLCEHVDDTLATIHRFVDLTPNAFPGSFKASEHHILGNTMRLDGEAKIRKNERWKTELSPDQLQTVTSVAEDFVNSHASHPLSGIIQHYLGR
jgi:hypothetical protein